MPDAPIPYAAELPPAEPLECLAPGPIESGIDRERYRVFIEEVADGFYETDLRGNFTFFNDALCRIFGRDREDIQDHNYRQFMDEANARLAFERFSRIYQTGTGAADIVWEITRSDGSIRILDVSANLILESGGQKIGFRGIVRDRTARYKARQELKESEQRIRSLLLASQEAERRYRGFLEFLPDPVFVFNSDGTVSYLKPAFEKVFGWTLAELQGRHIPFVPDELKEQTRRGIERLLHEKVINGFETQRLTKDGRLLDVVIDGALFYDVDGKNAGQVITVRDVTRERRVDLSTQALFRIAKALYQFRSLDERLEFIAKEVQMLVSAEGASVILLDEARQEFFFRVASYDNTQAGQKMKEIRFPADKGVAAQVYRTGKPLIVTDTSQSPYFFKGVDEQSQYDTHNMLDVPVRLEDRMIGVLCAVNKKNGLFDQTDVDILSAVASIVALPIENARINEQLQRSFEEVTRLNRAKDKVIHHLSHELKTPVAVLDASLTLLGKKLAGRPDSHVADRILERAQRSLQRLLSMQYEIGDILRQKDYTSHCFLTRMLEACIDEFEALVDLETDGNVLIGRIRDRIDAVFWHRQSQPAKVRLDLAVPAIVDELSPKFAHRRCRVDVAVEPAPPVWIPEDVLAKIVEGLVRNAVENTPDGSQVRIAVDSLFGATILTVADCGVGITAENQQLIVENFFTPGEPLQYASRRPYDFAAGGRGFDLLRMRIFSERYGFELSFDSTRCHFIPRSEDTCPGDIALCCHCRKKADCLQSGGTKVTLVFPSAKGADPNGC